MKVLIIEDEPLIALTLKVILEKRGFEVTGNAGNFKDANELFCNNIPDIIISDIKLEQNETGVEVVKQLQKIGDFQVIYITSYGDDSTIEEAIETNPIAYITKPFKENDLNAALKLASLKVVNKNLTSDYVYNKETRTLCFKNEQIILTKQESDLFHICYLNKGQFITNENIEYYIWGNEHVLDSTRRGLIYRLKKKLTCGIFVYFQGMGCKVDGLK